MSGFIFKPSSFVWYQGNLSKEEMRRTTLRRRTIRDLLGDTRKKSDSSLFYDLPITRTDAPQLSQRRLVTVGAWTLNWGRTQLLHRLLGLTKKKMHQNKQPIKDAALNKLQFHWVPLRRSSIVFRVRLHHWLVVCFDPLYSEKIPGEVVIAAYCPGMWKGRGGGGGGLNLVQVTVVTLS